MWPSCDLDSSALIAQLSEAETLLTTAVTSFVIEIGFVDICCQVVFKEFVQFGVGYNCDRPDISEIFPGGGAMKIFCHMIISVIGSPMMISREPLKDRIVFDISFVRSSYSRSGIIEFFSCLFMFLIIFIKSLFEGILIRLYALLMCSISSNTCQ